MDKELLIRDVYAREILDSKGYPAIEIEVLAGGDTVGKAAVSSGNVSDRQEKKKEAEGRQMQKQIAEQAVEHVNSCLAHIIIGMNVFDQEAVDQALIRMEGGQNPGKEYSGIDILRGVSTAVSRAAAQAMQIPLFRYLGGVRAKQMPMPAIILTGSGISEDSYPDIKELMIIPAKREDFREMLSVCTEVYHAMEAILEENTKLGKSENSVASETHMSVVNRTAEYIRMIQKAAERAGYCLGQEVEIGMNAGASDLYDRQREVYIFPGESWQHGHEIIRTGKEMVSYYEELISEFPIRFIEEPLAWEDDKSWNELCSCEWSCCSGVNQSGTVTELLRTISEIQKAGVNVIVSHPPGGVEDTAAADIAVACGAEWMKCGAPGRQECAAVYNRLLKIEEELR